MCTYIVYISVYVCLHMCVYERKKLCSQPTPLFPFVTSVNPGEPPFCLLSITFSFLHYISFLSILSIPASPFCAHPNAPS